MSVAQQIGSLPFNYWVANAMEMLERLAFFSLLAIRPLFAKAPASENGLELSYAEVGTVFGIWAWLQCIIPMISGGYTDRYGYRKSLIVAFILNGCGYLLLARALPVAEWLATLDVPNASFWVLLGAACLIGPGTAIFKPAVQGTLARVVNAETSSMAWGLFYWVVNVGGFLAPILAAWLRGEAGLNWSNVFYGCAIVTALNFIPALFIYREPERVVPAEGQKGPLGVFVTSLAMLLRDVRFVLFLLIAACFWFMFMQLWDLLPNFLNEWVDTSAVGRVLKSVFGENLTWVLDPSVRTGDLLDDPADAQNCGDDPGHADLAGRLCRSGGDQRGRDLLPDDLRVRDRRDDLQPDIQRVHRPDRTAGSQSALHGLFEHTVCDWLGHGQLRLGSYVRSDRQQGNAGPRAPRAGVSVARRTGDEGQ